MVMAVVVVALLMGVTGQPNQLHIDTKWDGVEGVIIDDLPTTRDGDRVAVPLLLTKDHSALRSVLKLYQRGGGGEWTNVSTVVYDKEPWDFVLKVLLSDEGSTLLAVVHSGASSSAAITSLDTYAVPPAGGPLTLVQRTPTFTLGDAHYTFSNDTSVVSAVSGDGLQAMVEVHEDGQIDKTVMAVLKRPSVSSKWVMQHAVMVAEPLPGVGFSPSTLQPVFVNSVDGVNVLPRAMPGDKVEAVQLIPNRTARTVGTDSQGQDVMFLSVKGDATEAEFWTREAAADKFVSWQNVTNEGGDSAWEAIVSPSGSFAAHSGSSAQSVTVYMRGEDGKYKGYQGFNDLGRTVGFTANGQLTLVEGSPRDTMLFMNMSDGCRGYGDCMTRGTCVTSPTGNATHCECTSSYTTGFWSGAFCDKCETSGMMPATCTDCQSPYIGRHCENIVHCYVNHGDCERGSCFGINASGHCTRCTNNRSFGPNCLSFVGCSTSTGTCDPGCWGVNGTGHCTSCNPGWTGPNCLSIPPTPPTPTSTGMGGMLVLVVVVAIAVVGGLIALGVYILKKQNKYNAIP